MQNNQDFDESTLPEENIFSDAQYVSEGDVTPIHMLSFAKKILIWLAVIYIMAAISEFFRPGNGIYETCKVTIPSLATLVIGYYFGASKN